MEPSREPSDVVCVDDATVTLGSNVILGETRGCRSRCRQALKPRELELYPV